MLNRSSRTLEWSKSYIGRSLSFDYLSLGRVHLLQAQREPHTFTKAANYLELAVDGLRQVERQDHLPRGLLARTEIYRVTGNLDNAQKDLDEAFAIASRGGMGLYLADCHLEYARLALAESNLAKVPNLRKVDEAREHLEIAKKMIQEMGYHRRDKEVEELEMSLRGAEHRGNLK